MYLFQLVFLFSSEKYPEVELLDCMVTISNFLKNFHTVFHSYYISLHSHQQCSRVSFSPLPYQHLLVLLIIAILMSMGWYVSLYFWFSFSWWLLMLTIFSGAYWPSICLWENVSSGPLPIFLSFWVFFFWCWVIWVLCILWILTPYQIYHLQVSSLKLNLFGWKKYTVV